MNWPRCSPATKPFSPQDLEKIRTTAKDLDYQILYLPGEELGMQQLAARFAGAHAGGLGGAAFRRLF